MDEYKKELEYFEKQYEDILDEIMKKYKNDFMYSSDKFLKDIDKEELRGVIEKEEFYFTESLNLGYRKNHLVDLLIEAKYYLDKIKEMKMKIPSERKKDYQRFMTKDEYRKKYERKKRYKRKLKLQKTAAVLAGVLIVAGGFAAGSFAQKQKDIDLSNNVCVEYTVKAGDRYNIEIKKLGLRDIGFGHYETKGAYRDSDIVYAGDIVIGRTTKENADYLVEQDLAKIISLEEAIDKLGETHTLIGEFKKAAEGKSDIVFYVPTNKKM